MADKTAELNRSLAELNERVAAALARHPHLLNRSLEVEACEGEVTLRGQVGSYFQKQMAQEMTRRLEGVRAIRNEIQVVW